MAAFKSGRSEEALDAMVQATLFAGVHNSAGFWNGAITYTIHDRKILMDAKVAGPEWNDYLNVLGEISLDDLGGRLALPEPSASMARAYLLSTRNSLPDAVEAARSALAIRPAEHVLQHGLGYYLDLAGSPEATEQYLAATLSAAAQKDARAVQWYAANWSRLRHQHDQPIRARKLPRSGPLRDTESGHVYQRLEIPLTWNDAREACRQLGGDLAVVTSASHNNLLHSRFATSHACWLGVRFDPGDRKWKSVHGQPPAFINWTSGQAAAYDDGTKSGYAAGFGNTPAFEIFGTAFENRRPGSTWFPWASHGLAKSRDYDDPLRNALLMYALCEWADDATWRRSLHVE
jgi:hypothetical protein